MINNALLVSSIQKSDSAICVSVLFQITFSFRLLQSIEKISRCYMVGPYWLSIFSKLSIFYFWFYWVFAAAWGLSLVAVSRGYSSLRCAGSSLWWSLLLWIIGSRHTRFSSSGVVCGL